MGCCFSKNERKMSKYQTGKAQVPARTLNRKHKQTTDIVLEPKNKSIKEAEQTTDIVLEPKNKSIKEADLSHIKEANLSRLGGDQPEEFCTSEFFLLCDSRKSLKKELKA